MVGFAAETGDATRPGSSTAGPSSPARAVDLLVVNEVGADLAFGADDNAAVVLGADGTETAGRRTARRSALADVIWDRGGCQAAPCPPTDAWAYAVVPIVR